MISPETMRFKLTELALEDIEADVAMGFVYETENGHIPGDKFWDSITDGLATEMAARGEFRGKFQSNAVIHRPQRMRSGRLVLVGAGPAGKAQTARWSDCVGSAWRQLRTAGAGSVAVLAPYGVDPDKAVRAVVEGIALAEYEPDVHKSSGRETSSLQEVTISATGATQRALDHAVATATAQNRARELANEPGNLLTPTVLAARAAELASAAGLECEVLDKAQLESLGMGALLGVARGSVEAPVMIVVRYRPDAEVQPETAHLGLVGKAVTFDTGGISIKPSKDMHLMKHDMAGGAAMLGAMLAIAALRPSIPVTAVIPSVENMPGGAAQRPGDIVKSRSGTTVEVLNTDAEGRLILADALTYAKELGCTHLVDAATLTGAIVVALGTDFTGLFSNDAGWRDRVVEASKEAGERMWPMPVGGEFSQLLKSPVADLANIGPRWGGACTAAAFLGHFAGDTPWVHLDIAGTAWYEAKLPHAPVGASGVAVATLARLAMSLG